MTKKAQAPVREGDVLAGKYCVERVLGSGAMGVVVAARHLELRELRALKFMLPAALANEVAVERFFREARAVVRLKSQHVARVHDMGRLDDGAPYIVMEYLEGLDLKQVLKQRGSLPVGEAVNHVLQACEALMEAHAAGVIHRDLKPANLFLTTGARGEACIKVLDFGIAKLIGGADASAEVTASSSFVGTPSYMSPEQMRGQSIDARCDVWALGVMLYRMLTGKVPFPGAMAADVWGAVLLTEPEPPRALRPELPEELQAVIMRCLRKDANERTASVAELCQGLAPFAGDSSAAALFARASSAPALPAEGARVSSPEGSTAPPWQHGKLADGAGPRRKRALWLALLVVAVVSVGTFAGMAVRSSATEPTAATDAVVSMPLLAPSAPVTAAIAVAPASAMPAPSASPLSTSSSPGSTATAKSGTTRPKPPTTPRGSDPFGSSRH